MDYGSVTYEDIVIAALLHDIGKIAQRAEDTTCAPKDMEAQVLPKAAEGEYYTHQHALYTYGAIEKIGQLLNEQKRNLPEHINYKNIARLAAMHHNPSHWAELLIAKSDRLSSGADRTENKNDQKVQGSFFIRAQKQALRSIFTAVKLKDESTPQEMLYQLQPLTGKNAYPLPKSEYLKNDYVRIWDGLLKSIIAINEKYFDDYLVALDAALEHWTWAVPSSTIDQPDISLYDHAKTTAAFSAVLYRWFENKNALDMQTIETSNDAKFCLITGDMSGIQNYLFDLKDTYKSTKILRARSFEIRAITDYIAQYILRKFNINKNCIISTAGGRFTILLPNYPDAITILEKIKEELDVFFIEKYLGSISLCISDLLICNDEDFMVKNGKFQKTFFNLQQKSFISKNKKLQKGLKVTGHIIETYYNKIDKGEDVCTMCDSKPIKKDGYCSDCGALAYLGEKLPKAKFIKFIENNNGLYNTEWIRTYESVPENEYGILAVNDYIEGKGIAKLPYTVPKDDKNKVLDFEDIVKNANGVKYLAMFKADLDNLGLVFSRGLGENISISRYATLSRMLDFFFSVRVRELIEEKYTGSIYCVYSGGDDVCVIGAWDKIIDFSICLQDEFVKYVGNNKNLSISAGITFAHLGLPIARISEKAEAQLELAKEGNKNAIAMINTRANWDEFNRAIERGKKFDIWIKNKKVSSKFIYRLLTYSEIGKAFNSGNMEHSYFLAKSHYLYMIKRNIDKNDDELNNTFKALVVNPRTMELSGISATYGLYSNREKEGGK